MPRINVLGYRIGVPGHPAPRIALGIVMVGGGVLGFLPILGYWMVPVGLAILAIDFPPVRRFHRRMIVGFGNWLHRRWPWMARHFGYGKRRNAKGV